MEGGWFKALPIFRTTRNKIGLLRSAYDCPTSMVIDGYKAQWIQGFFNHFASTAHAIGGKLLLKYPSTTFVKAKS